jgi:hypothetical protein
MLRRFILIGVVLPFLSLSAALAAQTTSSLDNPVPIGTAAAVGEYTVRVVEYVPDATDDLVSRNEENTPPEDGYVYALIHFEVRYDGEEVGKASSLQWQFVGSRRSAIPETSCTGNDRTFAEGTLDNQARESDIFPGGSVEFEQCVYLPSEEAGVVTLYVQTAEGERVFFQLNEGMTPATPDATPASGA